MKVTRKHAQVSTLALLLLAGCWSAPEGDDAASSTADEPSATSTLDARDPVQVCWDGFEPSGWGKLTECLEASLKREEAALASLLTKAGEQAGRSLDKTSAEQALRESNAQWVKYRDSECARRQAFVAGRNHPDIGELTCLIRETAERSSDLRFDESL